MANFLITAARKYTANYEGVPKSCWQSIILICINTFTIGVCFFLSLYFVNIQDFTPSMAGLLLSCYGSGTVTGGFITGIWADQFSPRIISILSLLVQSGAFFLLTWLQSFGALMLNLFFLGFAAYGFKTSNNVWMLSMCSDNANQRYRTLSISHVSANLGLGLSGIYIGSLAIYGFQTIFYLSSLLLLCSMLSLFFQKAHKETRAFLLKDESQYATPSDPSQIIWLVLSCVFLIGLVMAQLGSTYPLYIQELFPRLGVKAVSILFILDTFLIVFFQAPLTALVSKQNKLLVTGLGAFLMGFGMLVLTYSSVFALAIISCIIWTTGEMLFISTAQLLCYERSNNKKKGKSLGLFQTTYATSNIVGPILGGVVYQHWGGSLLWYGSMGIGTACFFLCWYSSRTCAQGLSSEDSRMF